MHATSHRYIPWMIDAQSEAIDVNCEYILSAIDRLRVHVWQHRPDFCLEVHSITGTMTDSPHLINTQRYHLVEHRFSEVHPYDPGFFFQAPPGAEMSTSIIDALRVQITFCNLKFQVQLDLKRQLKPLDIKQALIKTRFGEEAVMPLACKGLGMPLGPVAAHVRVRFYHDTTLNHIVCRISEVFLSEAILFTILTQNM